MRKIYNVEITRYSGPDRTGDLYIGAHGGYREGRLLRCGQTIETACLDESPLLARK